VADSPSGSRPLLRTGGIALLGIGVIAATVGLFTSATTGNGTGTAVPSTSAQAFPSSAEATAPAQPAPVPSDVVAPTDTSLPAVTAPAVPDASAAASPAPEPPAAPPPVVAAPAPPAADGGDDAARAPLRVYNNSLIPRLAAQAKQDFEARGWTVVEDGNYPEEKGVVAVSTAYFRPGTAEESAAQELGREFGLRVEPRFAGIAQATDGVIVIVTKDYGSGPKSS
jgi:LytR cell envelope-related transcriptional attenuator